MIREVERSVERVVPDDSHMVGVVRTVPAAPAAILRRAKRDENWLSTAEDWTERAGAPSGTRWRHESAADAVGDPS